MGCDVKSRQPVFAPTMIVDQLRRVGAAAIVTLCVGSVGGYAATSDFGSRFADLDVAIDGAPAVHALGTSQHDGDHTLVVVTMSAPSLAEARAAAPGQKVSDAKRNGIANAIAAQHASIAQPLKALGAKELAHYSGALNGIKIDVTKGNLAKIQQLPGVVSVLPVGTYELNNSVSVPFLGTPAVWGGVPGYRGEGIKIAIIDTGIDYTHSDFGGPGTAGAFAFAQANSSAPADPSMFGPLAAKVKGGIDLVGDAYNANTPGSTPQPDPNPFDCNGHGTHVAGTATGFGVNLDGSTYAGPYDTTTYNTLFKVGPGVAPKADLYSVRVFGCAGSTNVVTDAIDWAVQNNMDVISMSLGANFGLGNSSDAVAAQNAALSGITVVAASGNAGPAPYITSSPASGSAVITAAAMDATASFPIVSVALDVGGPLTVQNSNRAPLPAAALGIVVLRNPDGTISLGCNDAEYVDATIAGKLVVTKRGTCARVQRAQSGQNHGAAAVAMIDTSPSSFPPFEGPIPGVSIPFLGVKKADTVALTGAVPGGAGGPTTATLTAAGSLPNPGFEQVASFSSGGPRYGDSLFKPSVSAPGVSIFSAGYGEFTDGLAESGTSMATPHISGVAALVRQAHPGWSERDLRAAITQTGDPVQMVNYQPRLAGTGVVQPIGATNTQSVVVGTDSAPDPLSFGFAEFVHDYTANNLVDVHNNGASAATFNVTSAPALGSVPHTVSILGSTITVPAGGDAYVYVDVNVPAATVGTTHGLSGNDLYNEVAGTVKLTPTNPSMNGGASLTIPYYLVPRVRSQGDVVKPVWTNSHLTETNPGAAIPATTDVFLWGLSGTPQGISFVDTRAVGATAFPISATDSYVLFAINTFTRFSNAAPNEWDILIDTNGDGIPDYIVIAANCSSFSATAPNGKLCSATLKLSTSTLVGLRLADAPTDGTSIEVLVKASEIGVTTASPRFQYSLNAYSLDGSSESLPGPAAFNPFTPALPSAATTVVAPDGAALIALNPINLAEWNAAPSPLGIMAVTMDNANGAPQAALIPVPIPDLVFKNGLE